MLICPRCARSSPDDARYCYHDGISLAGSHAGGAVSLAQVTFPTPFYFRSGDACGNFDQLALACQARWDETRQMLTSGQFDGFLASLGRLDLARTAAEARALPDADHGVDYFLSRLPATNLAPPRLHVSPTQQQLGVLRPGQERTFDVELANDGHRLIVGHIRSDCPWLRVEGATGDQPRVLQFPQRQSVQVYVLGRLLAAGSQLREGRLLVDTNGGEAEIRVSCLVPVLPFPSGVLVGCTTPREVAQRAKKFPDQAALSFADGSVKAWYGANGWAYPVDEAPATGKAAVQQYFEALGLTKPPTVVVDTPSVVFYGTPGLRLREEIRLHSDDRKPIFAFGRSTTPWLTVIESRAIGNRAMVTIEADVPESPERSAAQLMTHLELRANGDQRFHVPVVLNVLARDRHVTPGPIPRIPPARVNRPVPVLAVALAGVALLVLATALWRWQPPGVQRSPLGPYAAAVSADTCAVFAADLDRLADEAALAETLRGLREGLSNWVHDLHLQPRSARPQRVFIALAPKARPLSVWTFDQPVQVGRTGQRYSIEKGDIAVDRVDRAQAWAVDRQGRLIGGTPQAVRAALGREQKAQPSPAYLPLAEAAAPVAPEAMAWAVGDFATSGAHVLTALAAADGSAPDLRRFHLQLVRDAKHGLRLRGRGAFPDTERARACGQRIAMLGGGALALVPALDVGQMLSAQQPWHVDRNDLVLDARFGTDAIGKVVQLATGELTTMNGERKKAVAAQDYEDRLKELTAGLDNGKLPDRLDSAIAELKKNPYADKRLDDLQREAAIQAKRGRVKRILNGIAQLVAPDAIAAVRQCLQQAAAVDPDDLDVQHGAAAVQQLSNADQALRRADKALGGKRADAAAAELSTASNALAQDTQLPPWPREPFKTHHDRLVKKTLDACAKVYTAYQEFAAEAEAEAAELFKQNKAAEAETACAGAVERLRRAQDILLVMRRLHGDSTALDAALKDRIRDLDRSGKRARCERLRTEAVHDLEIARAALETAVDAPKLVRPAQERVAQALDRFKQANEIQPDAAADRTAEAEKLWNQLERIVRPIALDLRTGPKGLPKDQWQYRPEDWAVQWSKDVPCLKAESMKSTTLESARCRWPEEFVLEMEFALLDEQGRVKNLQFETRDDPVTLVLFDEDGAATKIALGHPTKAKTLGWGALVQFGDGPSHPVDLERNKGRDQPIRLRLRSAKGPGARTLSLSVNQQVIGNMKSGPRIRSLKVIASNPHNEVQRWFVAIHRLQVQWDGLDPDNKRWR